MLSQSIDNRTHCDEMEMLSRTRFVAAHGVALFHARPREKDATRELTFTDRGSMTADRNQPLAIGTR